MGYIMEKQTENADKRSRVKVRGNKLKVLENVII